MAAISARNVALYRRKFNLFVFQDEMGFSNTLERKNKQRTKQKMWHFGCCLLQSKNKNHKFCLVEIIASVVVGVGKSYSREENVLLLP
jgi:hypothetical protein